MPRKKKRKPTLAKALNKFSPDMEVWTRGIYWMCLLLIYGVIFIGFSGNIQSQPFLDFIMTLGGATLNGVVIGYFNVVFGVLIILLFIMTLDLLWHD